VTRNLHSVELQNRAMSRASTRLRFIEPQLPTLVDQPPEGADWIHEIKHDGYRTMLVLERGKACAYTRNGHDWSDRYSGIIRAAVKHPCRAAILDGLRDHLLVERRAKLQTLLRSDPESPIQFSEEFIGDASAFLRRLCRA
jgi:ATP-dependent DNA ligase